MSKVNSNIKAAKPKHGKKHAPKKEHHHQKSHGVGHHAVQFVKAAAKRLGGVAMKKLTSWVTGHGDYHMSSHISSGRQNVSFGDSDCVVTHSEYLGDLTGSVLFTNYSYKINPTNPALFPWLATQASCYQEYEISGLILEFRSTSATALNSTNTALGTVIVSCNYDVDAPTFTSKFQMENYQGSVSVSPDHNLYYGVECKRSKTVESKLYTTQTSDDDRLSFLGNLQIATVGMQAAAIVGEVWVHYKVRLMKPKVALSSSALSWFQVGAVSSSITNGEPWGPAASSASKVNAHGIFAGAAIKATNPDRIEFPRRWTPGIYMVLHYFDTMSTFTTSSLPTYGGSLATNINSANMLTAGNTFNVRRADSGGVVDIRFVMVGDGTDSTNGMEDPCELTIAATGNNFTSGASSKSGLIIIPISSYVTTGYFSGGSNSNIAPLAEAVIAEVMRRLRPSLDEKAADPDPSYPPGPAPPGPCTSLGHPEELLSTSGATEEVGKDFVKIDDRMLSKILNNLSALTST